jgi:hypothetical protein
MKNETLKIGGGALPPTRAEIHYTFIDQRPQISGSAGRRPRSNRLLRALGLVTFDLKDPTDVLHLELPLPIQ